MGYEIGARDALNNNRVDRPHNLVATSILMGLGSGSHRAKSHPPIMHIGGCRRRGG